MNVSMLLFGIDLQDEAPRPLPFQARVRRWAEKCFSSKIADDLVERNYRFFEEATELVQSLDMSREDAHSLVDYVYGRPTGDPQQEAGGSMVTLALLCAANGISMAEEGETELERISSPEVMAKIKKKQQEKPRLVRSANYDACPHGVSRRNICYQCNGV